MTFRRFRARPRVRLFVFVLGILYLLAAGADLIAPYSEGDETSHLAFAPPNWVRIFRDGQLVRPYIYGLERTLDMETFTQVWCEDETQVYPVRFFARRTVSVTDVDLRYVPFPVSLIPEPLRTRWGVTPSASLHLFGVNDPNDRVRLYLWGADGFGGDVFGNILCTEIGEQLEQQGLLTLEFTHPETSGDPLLARRIVSFEASQL